MWYYVCLQKDSKVYCDVTILHCLHCFAMAFGENSEYNNLLWCQQHFLASWWRRILECDQDFGPLLSTLLLAFTDIRMIFIFHLCHFIRYYFCDVCRSTHLSAYVFIYAWNLCIYISSIQLYYIFNSVVLYIQCSHVYFFSVEECNV